MRRAALAGLILVVMALGIAAAASASGKSLGAPVPQSPRNGASAQSFPAIVWSAVKGAADYEYQIAADRKFGSIALGSPRRLRAAPVA